MAGVCTDKTLKALNKSQLIDLFLKSREKTENIINSQAEEIRELKKNFRRIESDTAIVKSVNNVLSNQVLSTERDVWRNIQYSRRECVEILGIPASVDHKEFEPTVCKILQHIDVDINEESESCHRGNKSSDRTILKFSRRKYCKKVTEVVVRRCSIKKLFLKISQNSQESTCVRVSFLIKLQA